MRPNPMEMELEIGMGRIHGIGMDVIGRFEVKGLVREGLGFEFDKHYIGQHHIYYTGHFEQCHLIMRGHWGFQPGGRHGEFHMRKVM